MIKDRRRLSWTDVRTSSILIEAIASDVRTRRDNVAAAAAVVAAATVSRWRPSAPRREN